MSGVPPLSHDVNDFYGHDTGGTAAAAAKHALAFGRTWLEIFGCMPSGSIHNAYCAGRIPDTPAVDRERFARFVTGTMRISFPPGVSHPNLSGFVEALNDPEVLRKTTIAKLADRYGAGDPGQYFHLSVEDARSEMVEAPGGALIPLDMNPITGHYVGPDRWQDPSCLPSAREAWRSVASRDALFYAQASQGMCLFVDSSAAGEVRGAALVAEEMSAASGGAPVVLMSDCPRTLAGVSSACGFYHYAYHASSPDGYMSLPRVFRSFVMFGGDGRRPPLCRNRSRCWYYAVNSLVSGIASEYAVVADAVDKLSKTAYLVPRLLDCAREKTIAIGVHPDTSDYLTGMENVPVVGPEEAGACAVYVSCSSGEGVELCMVSGGVAVCRDHRAVQDGINGFLCADAEKQSVREAVQRAVTCDRKAVGESASRLRLLHGPETYRWLWRGLLTSSDPLQTRRPQDAAVLHQRFLVKSASVRFREIVRCRAANVSRRAVMFVDNRPDPGTALAVLLTLCSLKPGWSIVGMVTGDSRPYFESVLGPAGEVFLLHMENYAAKNYFIEQYNDRMKRLETWLAVAEHADTALTVQSDGLLVRAGLEEHECMRRDYCGAPWKPDAFLHEATRGNMVGNGGFSLRSVMAMIRVCRERKRERISVYAPAPAMSEAEDVYFARYASDPCPLRDARSFSMEQFPDSHALGYHRFWMYHPVDFTERYFGELLDEDEEGFSPLAARPQANLIAPRPHRRGKTLL